MRRVCSLVLAAAIGLGSCLWLAPTTAIAKKGDKHFKQGLQYEMDQHWEKAVEEFGLAAAADPGNMEYQIHFRRAKFNTSQLYTSQGRALAKEGDYGKAYHALRQAYGFEPNELALAEMAQMLRLQSVKETNNSANSNGAKSGELQDRESQSMMRAKGAPLPRARTEPFRVVGYSGNLPSARAQEGGVTLGGTAVDATGALIPGEKLTLTNKKSGETIKTKSDDSGQFTFNNVMPGEYVLRGEAEGFQPAELAITVGTEQMKPIKLRMEISISEDVTISAKLVDPELPENNANALDIGANLMRGLPMRGDNILPVLSNFLSPAASGMRGPSIIVDGVEDSTLDIPSNSLKSVVINKNPYSAEYRRPGVARIEVTTKQGSRKLYDGSVAFYLRNSHLAARNAFALEKPDSDLRLFETFFSGPLSFIKRSRMSKKNVRKFVPSASYFVSGSRLNSNDNVVVNALTPSGAVNENVPTFKATTNLMGRIDLVPTRLTKLSFRYNFHDQPERNVGVGGLHLAEQGRSVGDRVHKFQTQESTAFSTNFLNTIRFVFERGTQREGIRATEPEIKVKGAFTGGPDQTAKLDKQTRVEIQDVASYNDGPHTLSFGGSFRPRFVNIVDASNFGGTFTFSDLTGYAANQPTLFQIVQGQPDVSFSIPEAYGFFQDDIRVTKDLNLMIGLRYEWQSQLKDYNNVAPRLALAFAPGDKKTVFRMGMGVFYDRMPVTVVTRSLLFDGQHTREVVIKNPSFPNPFIVGNQDPLRPSVWRIAADLSAPYLIQSSFGVERSLGVSRRLTVEYQTIRGVHLFRARNINAPLEIDGPLPNSDFGLINLVESSASLRSNAFIVTLQGGLFANFKGIVQYTLARTMDDTSGTFSLPANNYDLRSEWGRSDLDKQHRLNVAATLSLPFTMKLGGILSLSSGVPFNITTGHDDNTDRVVNDRPPGVFRNAGNGPMFAQLDFRLSKFIPVPTPFKKELSPGKTFRNLELNIDVYNVLNRNNLFDVVGETSSPLFGKASLSLQARTLQLSCKYNF